MGRLSQSRVLIIILFITITAIGINIKFAPVIPEKNSTLTEALSPTIDTWVNQGNIPLSDSIVKALELDDYLYDYFSNETEIISLYIGYYMSQKKIGAAHSPLVCFAGQGWEMSDIKKSPLQIGKDKINLASMIISKGEEKQLVLYWFQAFDKTSQGTFLQKLNLLQSKFLYSREDNAFVRVMIPFGQNKSIQDANGVGIQFIEQFYPIFKKFVISG